MMLEIKDALVLLRDEFKVIKSNAENDIKAYEAFLSMDANTKFLEVIQKIACRPFTLSRLAKAKKDLQFIQQSQEEFEQIFICLTHNSLLNNRLLPGAINGLVKNFKSHEKLFARYRSKEFFDFSIKHLEDCYKFSYSITYN